MRIVRNLIATTRLDLHGDRFTRESFERVVQAMSTRYVPMLWNHDPRHPPLGRSIRGEIEQLEDGEWGLVAVSEVFEVNDAPPLGDRDMTRRETGPDVLAIVFDRTYRDDHDQALFEELKSHGFRVEVEEKKAVEPLSILLLAAGAAAGMFAAGFLNKMGSDAWDAAKAATQRLLRRKREQHAEHLFIFELQLHRSAGPLSIRVILDTPTDELLLAFWNVGLTALEREALLLARSAPDEWRICVYAFTETGLVPQYAVRRDCFPLRFSTGSQ